MNTEKIPTVTFNPKDGTLILEGRSFPENPKIFYDDIFKKVEKELKTNFLKITMKLDYINSGSAKCILTLFEKLNIISNIYVTWISEEGDEDIIDLGKILQDSLNISFEFKEVI